MLLMDMLERVCSLIPLMHLLGFLQERLGLPYSDLCASRRACFDFFWGTALVY